MFMTPQAKSELSKTICSLRSHLLERLKEATYSTYRLQIDDIEKAELNESHKIKRARLERWLNEQIRAENKPDKEYHALRERFLLETIKRV